MPLDADALNSLQLQHPSPQRLPEHWWRKQHDGRSPSFGQLSAVRPSIFYFQQLQWTQPSVGRGGPRQCDGNAPGAIEGQGGFGAGVGDGDRQRSRCEDDLGISSIIQWGRRAACGEELRWAPIVPEAGRGSNSATPTSGGHVLGYRQEMKHFIK